MNRYLFIRAGVILLVLFGGLVGAGRPGGMISMGRFMRATPSGRFIRPTPSTAYMRPTPPRTYMRPTPPFAIRPFATSTTVGRSGITQNLQSRTSRSNAPSNTRTRTTTEARRTTPRTTSLNQTNTFTFSVNASVVSSITAGSSARTTSLLAPGILSRLTTSTSTHATFSAQFPNSRTLTPSARALEKTLQSNPQLLAATLLGMSPFGLNGLLGVGSLTSGLGDYGFSGFNAMAAAALAGGMGNSAATSLGGGGAAGVPPSRAPAYVSSQPQESNDTQQISDVLNARGLPNQAGRLYWPLGLRVLPPGPEVQQVRLQLDARLAQAATGGADASSLQEMSQAVSQLRYFLAVKGSMMARTTYLEAWRFLDRLDNAVRQLKG